MTKLIDVLLKNNLLFRGLALVLLVSVAVGFQQIPIPEFPGDGNPQHDHQPEFCLNYDTKLHAHNCSCRAMNPTKEDCEEEKGRAGGETSKCKVYCRKHACQCASGCTT